MAGDPTSARSDVYAYTDSLVCLIADNLSENKESHASASVGNYAIFAGGDVEMIGATASVDAYTTSLVRKTISSLGQKRYHLVGAANSKYAIFAGGRSGSTTFATVDAYTADLVKTTPPDDLIVGVYDSGATTIGENIFLGGGVSTKVSNVGVFYVYGPDLTRIAAGALSDNGPSTATSVEGFAIFKTSKGNFDVFDSSFTMTTIPVQNDTNNRGTAASVGSFALFGDFNKVYVATVA